MKSDFHKHREDLHYTEDVLLHELADSGPGCTPPSLCAPHLHHAPTTELLTRTSSLQVTCVSPSLRYLGTSESKRIYSESRATTNAPRWSRHWASRYTRNTLARSR